MCIWCLCIGWWGWCKRACGGIGDVSMAVVSLFLCVWCQCALCGGATVGVCVVCALAIAGGALIGHFDTLSR